MKLITAIIRPEKLDAVREALIRREIFRITVSRCTGRGRAETIDLYRGAEVAPDLIPKVRIDIACNEDFVEPAIEAICAAARHDGGQIGDGKIFITDLHEVVRIRTGERGGQAV